MGRLSVGPTADEKRLADAQSMLPAIAGDYHAAIGRDYRVGAAFSYAEARRILEGLPDRNG